ncbi:MAG: hypothetical protein J6Q22_21585 [Prevotella sp.]|nr:hypothetical protein [Prevotella sp.]
MKKVELSLNAAAHIKSLRMAESGEYKLTKDNIVNSMASISELINAGRDKEVIGVWIDDLLKVLYTLGQYNELVNELYSVKDNRGGSVYYSNDTEHDDIEHT